MRWSRLAARFSVRGKKFCPNENAVQLNQTQNCAPQTLINYSDVIDYKAATSMVRGKVELLICLFREEKSFSHITAAELCKQNKAAVFL